MSLIRSHGHKASDLGNLYVPVTEEEKYLKGSAEVPG